MPRQLPGLYWHTDTRRYFPFPQHHTTTNTAPTSTSPSPYRALSHLRSVLGTAHKDALIHQLQSSQISLTGKLTRSVIPSDALVSAFQSIAHNGCVYSFAGNTLGWFYTSIEHQEFESSPTWQPKFHLSSEVSSICLSGTTCVATTFGPECKILYAPLNLPVECIHRIDSRTVHDVWTADLLGSRLVLGANKQAVVMNDIDVCSSLQRLPTQSDVFALAQHENVLYTGLRNGGILRFDTRLQRSNSHHLFASVSEPATSITNLKHLLDHQLLASFIDGRISTFDLRFPIQTPLVTFTGNFNKYTVRLPLATDPYEKFLFVAGQDNRIRVWSLMMGGPALDPGEGTIDQTVFQQPFEHRIAALQVIKEREGMCLLAASGIELCKYSLGHRSGCI